MVAASILQHSKQSTFIFHHIGLLANLALWCAKVLQKTARPAAAIVVVAKAVMVVVVLVVVVVKAVGMDYRS